jgi:hypothetical protein|tara:strand:- start:3 stop:452 length:450 start_codon:yes stop_codon:yes gene_type:complete
MSLGFDAISALPISSAGPENSVNVTVTKNALTITIGSVGIIADSIVEDPDPNRLTLGLGTLSISGQANVSVTGSQVSLGLGTITVTADANVSPTGNALTLATGNVTITAAANVNPDKVSLSLDTVEPGVITWNDIIPGATMVWTPIKPY